MKRIALLVETKFTTRVIVEVPDDFDEETGKELFRCCDSPIPACSMAEKQLNEQLIKGLTEQVNDGDCAYMAITGVHNDREYPYWERLREDE